MITTNTGAKKIEGTDNWREIFDAHNDSVNAHDKVSEAMTYVVNGNKSIENAAIPVGSYVRLANSTIVGRSDGIYTVKTAIPVNTVIDSSYFNESAPIAGGVANALNSKFASGIVNSNDATETSIAGGSAYYIRVYFGKTLKNPKIAYSYYNVDVSQAGATTNMPAITNIHETYFDFYMFYKSNIIRYMWIAIGE